MGSQKHRPIEIVDTESRDIDDSILLIEDARSKRNVDCLLQFLRENKTGAIDGFCGSLSAIVSSSAHEYENLERMAVLVHSGILEELLSNCKMTKQEQGRVAILKLLSILVRHRDLRDRKSVV